MHGPWKGGRGGEGERGRRVKKRTSGKEVALLEMTHCTHDWCSTGSDGKELRAAIWSKCKARAKEVGPGTWRNATMSANGTRDG